MTQLNEIYKCDVCGNIVEMVHPSRGKLVCCDQEMQLMNEKTQDTGMEKHVPVTEDNNGKVKIKVGAVAHPMEEEHYIEWIETVSSDRVRRKYLKPGMQPETVVCRSNSDDVKIRAYCNVHGLWSDK